jgi:hypothetical protein
MSSMKEAKLWKLLEIKTKRTETLELTPETMDFINSGTSSMLMNGKLNQRKVNSMKSMDSL